MKKILLVLLTAIFISSLCFAAPKPAAPVNKPAGKVIETKTFIGRVASVSLGNEAKGISSHILVIDEKGQTWIFVVKSGTAITAKDGKALTLTETKKDNKVNVEYIIVEHETNEALIIHEARSIKLVE